MHCSSAGRSGERWRRDAAGKKQHCRAHQLPRTHCRFCLCPERAPDNNGNTTTSPPAKQNRHTGAGNGSRLRGNLPPAQPVPGPAANRRCACDPRRPANGAGARVRRGSPDPAPLFTFARIGRRREREAAVRGGREGATAEGVVAAGGGRGQAASAGDASATRRRSAARSRFGQPRPLIPVLSPSISFVHGSNGCGAPQCYSGSSQQLLL